MRMARVFGYPIAFQISQLENLPFPYLSEPPVRDGCGFRRTTEFLVKGAAKVMSIAYVRPANDNFMWKNPRFELNDPFRT